MNAYSVGMCKTAKRYDKLIQFQALIVTVWRIICENIQAKQTHISSYMNAHFQSQHKWNNNSGFGEGLPKMLSQAIIIDDFLQRLFVSKFLPIKGASESRSDNYVYHFNS